MNNESPAGVIVYIGCWVIGGVAGLLCVATLLGAATAGPVDEVP